LGLGIADYCGQFMLLHGLEAAICKDHPICEPKFAGEKGF